MEKTKKAWVRSLHLTHLGYRIYVIVKEEGGQEQAWIASWSSTGFSTGSSLTLRKEVPGQGTPSFGEFSSLELLLRQGLGLTENQAFSMALWVERTLCPALEAMNKLEQNPF